MVWVLWVGLAWAGASDANVDAETTAEVRRLGDEIERLVQKGAWKGVERKYMQAKKTGAELSAAMHRAGARSSLLRGDATEARLRLLDAYEQERDPEVLAWLTTFSRQYTTVQLRADPGAELQVERRHFDQERARVVDRAAELLAGEGAFEGLLPMGRYRVGAFWFTIGEDHPGIEADLRACAKDRSCTD
jgi:hypothetical protein